VSWVHLSDSRPVARNQYRCMLCWCPIPQGEKHHARRGIGDEGPLTYRTHLECIGQTEDWTEDECESAIPGILEPPERIREWMRERKAEKEG